MIDEDTIKKFEEDNNVDINQNIIVDEEPKKNTLVPIDETGKMKNAMQMQYTNAIADTRKRLNEIVDDSTYSGIGDKVKEKLTDEKYVNKRSKDLEKVADEDVTAEIDKKRIEVKAKKAKNKADKQAIENELYQLKQEKKRIVKFQKALNEQQKRNIKETEINQLWDMHKETLEQYEIKKTNGKISVRIILFFDGIKCTFVAMNKANNKLMKLLKYVIIIGVCIGVFFLLKHFGIIN